MTYHGFVRDGFDEAVEDLGEGVGADASTTDVLWFLVHAFLPDLAHGFHVGGAGLGCAAVLVVLL